MPKPHATLYRAILLSGLRINEIEYLRKNKERLKTQIWSSYVKIPLNWVRGQKSAYFAYLPLSLWKELQKCRISTSALKTFIKRKKLLPLKYLRNYFYTTSISLGCPEAIVDHFQGRKPRGVGPKHYLQAQELAKSWYPKIAQAFYLLR